jgi:hypothetical protein
MNILHSVQPLDAFGEDIFARMKGHFTLVQISRGEAAGRGAAPLCNRSARKTL